MAANTLTILQLQEFLGLVQSCFISNDCIIAGGAVRDVLNRRPVKDVDVFIQGGPQDLKHATKLADKLYTKVDVGTGDEKDYPDNEATIFVVKMDRGIGSFPCDLVFLNCDPVENVRKNFDFDLSQAWVTRYRTWTTPACRKAMIDKQITYTPCKDREEFTEQNSAARLLRLREKYVGWRFSSTWKLDRINAAERS